MVPEWGISGPTDPKPPTRAIADKTIFDAHNTKIMERHLKVLIKMG